MAYRNTLQAGTLKLVGAEGPVLPREGDLAEDRLVGQCVMNVADVDLSADGPLKVAYQRPPGDTSLGD